MRQAVFESASSTRTQFFASNAQASETSFGSTAFANICPKIMPIEVRSSSRAKRSQSSMSCCASASAPAKRRGPAFQLASR
jgi:hypothetical protein